MSLNKPSKIVSLQVVRALAFLGIFLSHCSVIELGAWGVSLFFILSGFLMVYSYHNRTLDTSVRSCVKFSIGKIEKLYWLHILMMLAALPYLVKALILDFSPMSAVACIGEIILNVLLLQAWSPSKEVYFSLNGVAWYLSVCLFLYFCFPIIFNYIKGLSSKKSFAIAARVYTIQILIGALSQFVDISIPYFNNFSEFWVTYIFPLFRLGDFMIGCCLGNIFLNTKLNFGTVSSTLFEMAAFIGIFVANYISLMGITGINWFINNMIFTPTSVCIILLFASKKGLVSRLLTCRPLIYIGNISSYAFLIHQIVIRYIVTFSKILVGHVISKSILSIGAFIVTILCSELYMEIERRIKARE